MLYEVITWVNERSWNESKAASAASGTGIGSDSGSGAYARNNFV